MKMHGKWLLVTAAAASVLYSVMVLGFAVTSPDLRLRCLMVDSESAVASGEGVEIRATPGLQFRGEQPEPGDVLLRVGDHRARTILDRRTRTFIDFTEIHRDLRKASIPPGGQLYAGADPSELQEFKLPPLVQDEDGNRFVKIQFVPSEGGTPVESWLLVQSLPLGKVLLSLVWFVLQLGIAAVGALAVWYRPFDRAARLFFAMCIVNLVAFVGGYHWWIIAGSFWLAAPFAACAVLVPAVSLHFFIHYPQPKRFVSAFPRLSIAVLYAVPGLAVLWILATMAYAHWLHAWHSPEGNVAAIIGALAHLHQVIYAYFAVAGLYFALILAAIWHAYRRVHNPLERNQLRWIWYAGIVAGVCVAISLALAVFRPTTLALGGARIPMFLASSAFMLAYAVGMARYKLMLLDQIVSKGVWYYVVGCGITLLFGLTMALGALVPQHLNISLTGQQALAVVAVLTVSIVILLWLRDRIQQTLDRRFFREKYQLDKALQRVHRAIGDLTAPESLGSLMLGSCRDVLRVQKGALYLRSSPGGSFTLIASQGAENVPVQLQPDEQVVAALRDGGSLQRVSPGMRGHSPAVQHVLRELQMALVHPLEVDGRIAGLVLLGEKKNAATFTAEDLTFLNALGQITNVALHSAKVDQDVTRLNEELREKVQRITQQSRQIAALQTELAGSPANAAPSPPRAAEPFRREAIKGNSPAIRGVLETVRKVAASESSVLIHGESGTGKELLAQAIHDNSPRRSGPLVRVHCAALSPGLLESELFGHVKGAFTGAHQDKIGRFEMASGGTLFLDEIGDISLETQIKLLRVLQEHSFEPVGGTRTVHADVRLITATHQNLERLIEEGTFREDLYYRLNVINVTLPPLRERREDILELAFYFLKRTAERLGKPMTRIDEDALAALERHSWPGNIRELENLIERAVVLADGDCITRADLPAALAPHPDPSSRAGDATPARRVPEATSVAAGLNGEPAHNSRPRNHVDGARSERDILERALRECNGNKAQAARKLGIPRSTYYSKLQKYAIS